MLSFVRLDASGGIWANPEEALKYLDRGFKVYTGTDQATEVTEEELKAAVDYDSRESTSSMVAVAAGAEG